jgi:hypothetical protein
MSWYGRVMMDDFERREMEENGRDFELGIITATPGALLDFGPALIAYALARHSEGDWGEISEADRAENELSLEHGFRLMSAYDTTKGRIWVITESDRSSTCILRPEDY